MSASKSISDEAVLAVGEDFSLVMAQYMEIKAENQDYILFFRAGSGYLLFSNDAEVAAERARMTIKFAKYCGEDFPIGGAPVETANAYAQKLVAAGLSVAICEQVESFDDARNRGTPFVVRREVVRSIIPTIRAA